jgi:hypothetical protein
VFDLDSHVLSGREAGLFKPHAGDAQPRKKPWCSPGPSLFGAGPPAHDLLDGSVALGMSGSCAIRQSCEPDNSSCLRPIPKTASKKFRGNDMSINERKIVFRYVKAYLSVTAVIGFFLGISLMKEAGWKPLLIPLPLFIILFGGVTYQLIQELRELKKNKGE